ncbi:hypothetical protein DENSPDRAFT_852934 [Dentipellis sp. KUC8613]|nr:hypothetical protein DENSPDRAFT_852934 [Dentipellis sp. KUC8613]
MQFSTFVLVFLFASWTFALPFPGTPAKAVLHSSPQSAKPPPAAEPQGAKPPKAAKAPTAKPPASKSSQAGKFSGGKPSHNNGKSPFHGKVGKFLSSLVGDAVGQPLNQGSPKINLPEAAQESPTESASSDPIAGSSEVNSLSNEGHSISSVKAAHFITESIAETPSQVISSGRVSISNNGSATPAMTHRMDRSLALQFEQRSSIPSTLRTGCFPPRPTRFSQVTAQVAIMRFDAIFTTFAIFLTAGVVAHPLRLIAAREFLQNLEREIVSSNSTLDLPEGNLTINGEPITQHLSENIGF